MAKPLFTREQERFIRKNVKGRGSKELANLVNAEYGISVTEKQVRQYKASRGLKGGLTQEVGAESIVHGYVMVKVRDTGRYEERWQFKHKLIWEKVYGPIPPGRAIIFVDQNPLNVTLENLMLISKKQLGVLNKLQLLGQDKELNRTAIHLAALRVVVAKKEGRLRNAER